MTTRPTDEEIRGHINYFKALGYPLLVEHLQSWLTERQAARAGVTNEMVEVACNGYNQALRDVGYNDEMDDGLSYASPMAMRAALQSIALPVRVPDALSFHFENYEWSKEALLQHHSYVQGWNDCREAMLSTSPQPQQAVKVPNAYELWAAAQLVPGEGIEDGARRIEAILSCTPAYNGKKEG